MITQIKALIAQMYLRNQQFNICEIPAKRGQIAVGFLALMAFMIGIVGLVVNLGEMAQVRVETSNAADAGALAAASWIASGENEAALVSRKMLDAVAMVQAIYLVPFCQGAASQQYANALWNSLVVNPNRAGWVGVAGPEAAWGPSQYFHDVADATMRASWNVGRREFLTASLNNMMMRFNTTTVARGTPVGGVGIALDSFGSLPQAIQADQNNLYNQNIPNISEEDLVWNNGLPLTDPQVLQHVPDYHLENYPSNPPTLAMGAGQATYYQYLDPPAPPMGFFNCDFTGRGITNTTGPYVDLSRVTLASNPLAVDATGRKGWDFDLAPTIPGINHPNPAMRITVGDCLHTCGMVPRQASAPQVFPAQIQNGTGTITVTVTHKVQAGTGEIVGSWFGAIPVWQSRFDPVGSRAVAQYTSPQIAGGFGVANPTATASLVPGQEQ